MKYPVILITFLTLAGCMGGMPVLGDAGGSGGGAGATATAGAGGGAGGPGGVGGAGGGAGGAGDEGPLADYPAELRAFTTALCSVNDRCAATHGRLTVESPLCEIFFARYVAAQTSAAPDTALNLEAMAACANIMNQSSCGAHVAEAWADEPACQDAFVLIPKDPTQPGDACDSVCSKGRCLESKSEGYRCRRCETVAANAESCADAVCDTDSYCNVDSVCEPLDTKSCGAQSDCSAHDNRYFCDNGTCALRKEGAPCLYANYCGQPGLECISGLCANRAKTGGVCDDSNDCNRDTDACIGGICTAAVALGDACNKTSECLGWRQCINGTCQNPPGHGEPCDDFESCEEGASCVNGICQVMFYPPLELGVGQTCASLSCTSALQCEWIYGTCVDGFCDRDGIDGALATNACEPYRGFGESCDDSSQCDPAVHACAGGVCRLYREVGQTCGATPCNPATSYCDNGTCVALGAFAAACEEGSTCASGQCVGVCAGGTYKNLPCDGADDCPGSSCDGLCGDGSPYPMCTL